MNTTAQHKPGCMANINCAVFHNDGICPGPYGECTCANLSGKIVSPTKALTDIQKEAREAILIKSEKDPATGCWNWKGSFGPKQYGSIQQKGKSCRAHRVSYEAFREPIPEGLHIDHLCRNHSCVNPDHLEAVTPVENVMRGFSPHAMNKRKTHCNYGHELNKENIYPSEFGWRVCRICKIRRATESTRQIRQRALKARNTN